MKLLDYDVTRTVYLDDIIDDSLTGLRHKLTKLAVEDKTKPILLIISSPGGRVDSTLTLVDHIVLLRKSGARIDGLVEGHAESGALIVLQACDRRLSTSPSLLMVHGMSGDTNGDEALHKSNAKMASLMKTRLVSILVERTGKSSGYWSQVYASSVPRWMTADVALKQGLLDELLEV